MLRTLLIAGIVTCAGAVAQPQEMPKPGAEQRNLARFAGTWKMEGMVQASRFGPGGPMSGTETCRMFEGGWHLVCDASAATPMGPVKTHAIMTYDSAAKTYRHISIGIMGDAQMSTGTRDASGWTLSSTLDMNGKTIRSRLVITDTTPGVHAFTWEVSEDGKTWQAIMKGTSIRSS